LNARFGSHAPAPGCADGFEDGVPTLSSRLDVVRRRIEAACARTGRNTREVRLLPVSKTVPLARLRAAAAAGLTEFGENKVQELRAKAAALSDLGLRWSLIGHLQTNKVKLAAQYADEFQALDSLRLAEALDRRLQATGRSLDVLIQINSSGEASKYGLEPSDAPAFIAALPAYGSLRVRGLMTLAAFSADVSRVRACFRLTRELQERLRERAPVGQCFDALSMGMSNDYEIAIEEGATVVRVGQALFGPRALPDSHYWPGMGAA
jgi:pyridoxal phosphate enzyme (YggS family)